jgi:hypothetical protein
MFKMNCTVLTYAKQEAQLCNVHIMSVYKLQLAPAPCPLIRPSWPNKTHIKDVTQSSLYGHILPALTSNSDKFINTALSERYILVTRHIVAAPDQKAEDALVPSNKWMSCKLMSWNLNETCRRFSDTVTVGFCHLQQHEKNIISQSICIICTGALNI